MLIRISSSSVDAHRKTFGLRTSSWVMELQDCPQRFLEPIKTDAYATLRFATASGTCNALRTYDAEEMHYISPRSIQSPGSKVTLLASPQFGTRYMNIPVGAQDDVKNEGFKRHFVRMPLGEREPLTLIGSRSRTGGTGHISNG